VAAAGPWVRGAHRSANDPVEYRATVRALRATAERALAAHQEARQLGKELGTLARAAAPALLAQRGVGPVTAAQVLISWSHPGRLRSEAAFARGQERPRDPPVPQADGRSPAVPSPGAASPDPGHAVTASRVSAEATLSTGGGRDPVDTPTTRGGRRPRRRRRQRPALPGRAAGSCLRGLRPAGCIPASRQQRPAP
jgi:transposase